MESFLKAAARRSLRPGNGWSLEEHALFAARKEFELLKLLSTDAKALMAARRLGFLLSGSAGQPHPQQQGARAHCAGRRDRPSGAPRARPGCSGDDADASPRDARSGGTQPPQPELHPQGHPASASPPRDAQSAGGADSTSATTLGGVNARRRRGRERSARHHASRRRALWSRTRTRLLLVIRLRRAVAARGMSEAAERAALLKRQRDQASTPSTSSSGSADASRAGSPVQPPNPPAVLALPPIAQLKGSGKGKVAKGGWGKGFLLR